MGCAIALKVRRNLLGHYLVRGTISLSRSCGPTQRQVEWVLFFEYTNMRPLDIQKDNWRSRWLVFDDWNVLHRVAKMTWHEEYGDKIAGQGMTVCEKEGFIQMPGIYSRMGLDRCPECCKAMGVTPGKGNPYNDGIKEAGD